MQLSAYLPKGSYRVYKLHQLVPVWIFSFNGRCEIFILGQPRNPPWLHLGTPLDFQDSWKTDLQLVHRMNTCELLVGKGGCGWCEEILEVICNEPINIWSNRCFEAQILFFPQNLGKLYLLWKIEIKENELIMAMQSLLSFSANFMVKVNRNQWKNICTLLPPRTLRSVLTVISEQEGIQVV